MLERKGLGIRFAAAVIDAILLAIPVNIVINSIGGVVGLIVAALVTAAYPLIEIAKAQSPGKMILKLRVTSEDGSPATRDQLIQRAIVRWSPTFLSAVMYLVALVSFSLYFLGALGMFVLGIVLLVMSWQTINSTRQGFWDIRAKTAVMGPATGPVPFQPPTAPGFQPIMPGQPMPPTGTPVTPPPATTMPPPPQG